MTRLRKKETETIIFFFGAFGIFLMTRVFHDGLTFWYDDSYYLVLHTIFELFSIFVSFSIFFYGWLTFPYTQSQQKLTLSLIFFVVGVLDLAHTLTYKGMPFYQHEHTIAIATWFWILARFTESIGLGLIFIKGKEYKLNFKQKNIFLISACLYNVFLVVLILTNAENLPVLLIEGEGVTSIKIAFEYVISIIHLVTLLFIFKDYRRTKNPDDLTIIVGVIFLFFGELIFTLYLRVYDLDNLLGHIYKALGYFFLLKGIFFPQFARVYTEREQVKTQWKIAEEKLQEQEKKLTSAIIHAQEDERRRVSRELHDGVGQSMYSILMSVRMFKRSAKEQKMLEQIGQVENLISSSMTEVKNIAYQLRPSALDDLGLIPALRSHIARYEQTFGTIVNFRLEGKVKRFDPEVETALYRIFQEALNNAAKYAETDSIDIDLIINEDGIQMTVKDYGKGFDIEEYIKTQHNGLGLFGMQERAALINGSVSIDSEIGNGTLVSIFIPNIE
ncbi:MASE3 domain-containing protein [Bacillus tianshenii]|nr:MASE3 domain-containing protein [Bacillus tianshenii]